MSVVAPQVGPLRLVVRQGLLDCPRRGHAAATQCERCRYLHGTLDGVELTVLCGLTQSRPAILRPGSLDEPLIFNMDWPND
jgi:hypothetical protein